MAGAEHFDVVATVFVSTLRLLSIESYPDSTINLLVHATPPLRDNVFKASHHKKTVVYSRRLAPSTTLCCSTSVSVPEPPKVCGKHPIINVGPRFDGAGETRPLSACLAAVPGLAALAAPAAQQLVAAPPSPPMQAR